MIKPLTSDVEFRDALKRRVPFVITDSTGHRFHQNPWSCGHVDGDSFHVKVVQNEGKGGRYFTVDGFAEAEARWPSLSRCS